MRLIIDSGSTKTDWCFVKENKVVNKIKTAGINPYYPNPESSPNALAQILHPVFEGHIEAIDYYGTGITGEAAAARIKELLLEIFPDTAEVTVSSDLLGAAKALFHNKAGIAVILGTGANTGFYNGTSISEQHPPLGFWLGDEASGAYFGKEFIKLYLRNELSFEEKKAFEDHFGVLTRLQILENAYQKPFPNRWFASFAPFVLKNRTLENCNTIVEEGLDSLFQKYLLKYQSIHKSPVGFVGSIAYHLSEELEKKCSEYSLHLGEILASPMERLIQNQ